MSRVLKPWKQNNLLFTIFCRNEKKHFDRLLQTLNEFSDKFIHERRKYLLEKVFDNGGHLDSTDPKMSNRTVFLDILLQSTVDGRPLTNAEIREEVNTIVFGVST